jgi:galactokinase
MSEEIEKEDEGIDVEIETSGEPTSEQETPVKVEATEKQDELADYSTKVQARIKKLTERYRNEERDKEEASRLAQQLLEENKQLKSRMTNLDKGYLNEYGNRLNAQTESIKRAYREAHESGESCH